MDNLRGFSPPEKITTPDKFNYLSRVHANAALIEKTLSILYKFLSRTPKRSTVDIESERFRLAFSSSDMDFTIRALPVYLLHDDFLYGTRPVISLDSSSLSGKTLCAPILLSLCTVLEGIQKSPFIMLSQSSQESIAQQKRSFSEILGDSVAIVTDIKEFMELYMDTDTHAYPTIAIFVPENIL